MVNAYQALIGNISCVIFILSGHTHDDDDHEPHITEEVFFSCKRYRECFPLEFMLKNELKKQEVSSFEIVASLYRPRGITDRLHYVMYRIGRKENGLQIFYQCLKETQDRDLSHRYAVQILKMKSEFRALKHFLLQICYYTPIWSRCKILCMRINSLKNV